MIDADGAVALATFRARILDFMSKWDGAYKGDDGSIQISFPSHSMSMDPDENNVRLTFSMYPVGPCRRYQYAAPTLKEVVAKAAKDFEDMLFEDQGGSIEPEEEH
jgi:hypothetical protein